MKPTSTDTQQIEREIASATDEQAADLAALTAAAGEAPGVPAQQAEQEAQGPNLAGEIAAAVTVAVATLGPMFPSLKGIYTPEVTQAAAQSIAAVCNKHGWLQGGLMGKWGEEIACLAVVAPLAFQTYQGVRADIEARKPPPAPDRLAGPDLAAKAPNEAPGQKTVTFGAPVPVEAEA